MQAKIIEKKKLAQTKQSYNTPLKTTWPLRFVCVCVCVRVRLIGAHFLIFVWFCFISSRGRLVIFSFLCVGTRSTHSLPWVLVFEFFVSPLCKSMRAYY